MNTITMRSSLGGQLQVVLESPSSAGNAGNMLEQMLGQLLEAFPTDSDLERDLRSLRSSIEGVNGESFSSWSVSDRARLLEILVVSHIRGSVWDTTTEADFVRLTQVEAFLDAYELHNKLASEQPGQYDEGELDAVSRLEEAFKILSLRSMYESEAALAFEHLQMLTTIEGREYSLREQLLSWTLEVAQRLSDPALIWRVGTLKALHNFEGTVTLQVSGEMPVLFKEQFAAHYGIREACEHLESTPGEFLAGVRAELDSRCIENLAPAHAEMMLGLDLLVGTALASDDLGVKMSVLAAYMHVSLHPQFDSVTVHPGVEQLRLELLPDLIDPSDPFTDLVQDLYGVHGNALYTSDEATAHWGSNEIPSGDAPADVVEGGSSDATEAPDATPSDAEVRVDDEVSELAD